MRLLTSKRLGVVSAKFFNTFPSRTSETICCESHAAELLLFFTELVCTTWCLGVVRAKVLRTEPSRASETIRCQSAAAQPLRFNLADRVLATWRRGALLAVFLH